MNAARFAVTVHELLVGAIEKDHLHIGSALPQLPDHAGYRLEERLLAGIDRERDALDRRVGLRAQREKLLDQLNGKIIDAVVAEIFEGGGGGALAASRHANQSDPHTPSPTRALPFTDGPRDLASML